MKKIAIYLTFALAVHSIVAGQALDTIDGRASYYYINDWYTECYQYTHCTTEYADRNWFYICATTPDDSTMVVVQRYTSPGPVAITGLAAMVEHFSGFQEHLLLYQHDTNVPGNLRLMDSVRWDLGKHHVVKLPQCVETMNLGDPTKFLYIDVYENFFDSTIIVDTVFYVGGTHHGRMEYASVAAYGNDPCDPCMDQGHKLWSRSPSDTLWHPYQLCSFASGPFFAIVDTSYSLLTVQSNHPAMGTVSGSGYYFAPQSVSISATPYEGFLFKCWSDSVADNPRSVLVTSDTLFTALFILDTSLISIEDIETPAFTLSPNPAITTVTLTTSSPGPCIGMLLDQHGRLLRSASIVGSVWTIDIAALPKGVYYAILDSAGKKTARSFVKQ